VSDVISLFDQRKKVEKTSDRKEEADFTDIMKKNAEKKAKLERERLGDNKSVLHAYRIKN